MYSGEQSVCSTCPGSSGYTETGTGSGSWPSGSAGARGPCGGEPGCFQAGSGRTCATVDSEIMRLAYSHRPFRSGEVARSHESHDLSQEGSRLAGCSGAVDAGIHRVPFGGNWLPLIGSGLLCLRTKRRLSARISHAGFGLVDTRRIANAPTARILARADLTIGGIVSRTSYACQQQSQRGSNVSRMRLASNPQRLRNGELGWARNARPTRLSP